jgi:hypothetical protein
MVCFKQYVSKSHRAGIGPDRTTLGPSHLKLYPMFDPAEPVPTPAALEGEPEAAAEAVVTVGSDAASVDLAGPASRRVI